MVLYLNENLGDVVDKDSEKFQIGPQFLEEYKSTLEDFCLLKDFNVEIGIPEVSKDSVLDSTSRKFGLDLENLHLQFIVAYGVFSIIYKHNDIFNYSFKDGILFAPRLGISYDATDKRRALEKFEQITSENFSANTDTNFNTEPLGFFESLIRIAFDMCNTHGLKLTPFSNLKYLYDNFIHCGFTFAYSEKEDFTTYTRAVVAMYSIQNVNGETDLIVPTDIVESVMLYRNISFFMLLPMVSKSELKEFVESGEFYSKLLNKGSSLKVSGLFVNFRNDIHRLWKLSTELDFFRSENYVLINAEFLSEIMELISKSASTVEDFSPKNLRKIFSCPVLENIQDYNYGIDYEFIIKRMGNAYVPNLFNKAFKQGTPDKHEKLKSTLKAYVASLYSENMEDKVSKTLKSLYETLPSGMNALDNKSVFAGEPDQKTVLWYTEDNFKLFVYLFVFLFCFPPFNKLLIDYKSLTTCSGLDYLALYYGNDTSLSEHERLHYYSTYKRYASVATENFFSGVIASAIALGFHGIEFYELGTGLGIPPSYLTTGRTLTSILSGDFSSEEVFKEKNSERSILGTYTNTIVRAAANANFSDLVSVSPAIVRPAGNVSGSALFNEFKLYNLNFINNKLLEHKSMSNIIGEEILIFKDKKTIPKAIRDSDRIYMVIKDLDGYVELDTLDVLRMLFIKSCEKHMKKGSDGSVNYSSMSYISFAIYIESLLKVLGTLLTNRSEVVSVPDIAIYVSNEDYSKLRLTELIPRTRKIDGEIKTTTIATISENNKDYIPPLYVTLKKNTRKPERHREVTCFTSHSSNVSYALSANITNYSGTTAFKGAFKNHPNIDKEDYDALEYGFCSDINIFRRVTSATREVKNSNLSFGLRGFYKKMSDYPEGLNIGDIIFCWDLGKFKPRHDIDLTSVYFWVHTLSPDWVCYLSETLKDLNSNAVEKLSNLLFFQPYIDIQDVSRIFDGVMELNDLGSSRLGDSIIVPENPGKYNLASFVYFGPALQDENYSINDLNYSIVESNSVDANLMYDYGNIYVSVSTSIIHQSHLDRTISICNDSVWKAYREALEKWNLFGDNQSVAEELKHNSSTLGWYVSDHTPLTPGNRVFKWGGILYDHLGGNNRFFYLDSGKLHIWGTLDPAYFM